MKRIIILRATAFITAFILALAVTLTFRSFLSHQRVGNPAEPPVTRRIPSFVSSVPSVTIVDISIDAGSPDLIAKVRYKNGSAKPIMAFLVESSNDIDGDGHGQIQAQQPIAGSFEEFTVDLPLNQFSTGMPLRLSAVVFADGSAEGEVDGAASIKRSYEDAKANYRRDLFHR
jgi:hypothetical protein